MKTQPDQQLPESICEDGSIAIPDNEDAQEILAVHRHTPGDWRVSSIPLHRPERYKIISGDTDVANIEARRFNDAENQANVRLFAAAPELLAALQAVSRLDYLNEHNALAKLVQDAITKATR